MTAPVHRRSPFLIGFLLVVVVGVGVVAIPASAAWVELGNETVTVDADTDTAYAEFTNANLTTAANVSATFYAVDNGTETEVSQQNVTVPADGKKLVESPSINGTANDSVRIKTQLDNATVSKANVSVTTGTFQQVAGGGGIGGTGVGSGAAIGAAFLVLAAVGAFLVRD